MKNKLYLWAGLVACAVLTGACYGPRLITHSVAYQSVRTEHAQPTPESPIPDAAKIAVAYSISSEGDLTAIVYNRTDEIMTIDQTLSFFVNSTGKSTSYYDPTVRTTATTDISSRTKGATVNLGAVAGALGVGGVVGQIANGINVGGSGTSGQSVTNTTYVADLPRVSLAPRSSGAMSKVFRIIGIGKEALETATLQAPLLTEKDTYCRFSVCISYSVDGGNTFQKLVTNFYADSQVVAPVMEKGLVNDALRQVYLQKPDAPYEPWWMLKFNYENVDEEVADSFVQGFLYDYQ